MIARLMLTLVAALLTGSAAFAADAGKELPVREPLRLTSGEPLVGIYFFGHWWDPWKSSDEAMLVDLKKIRAAGINTIYVDHQASQALDGNFRWLDREHKAAKEAGVQIVPWLSLGVFGDMTVGGRDAWAKERYGVAVTTSKFGYVPYGAETIEFGVNYTREYIKRYKDQALLHVRHNGKDCPVVALTAEIGWGWQGPLDPQGRMHFSRWLRNKYSSVERLNKAWKTSYEDFFEVDASDQKVFDVAAACDSTKRTISVPVRDHMLFRAQIISDSLAAMRARLRKEFPDLLIVTEIPYAFGDEHPHAWGFTVSNASISEIAEHADIVMLRGSGVVSQGSRKIISDYIDRTGKYVVLNHRIAPDQGPGLSTLDRALVPKLYAAEAAAYFNGIGLYSWNEMVDVHMVPNEGSAPPDAPCQVSRGEHVRLYGIAKDICQTYQGIYRDRKKTVQVPPPATPDYGLRTIH